MLMSAGLHRICCCSSLKALFLGGDKWLNAVVDLVGFIPNSPQVATVWRTWPITDIVGYTTVFVVETYSESVDYTAEAQKISAWLSTRSQVNLMFGQSCFGDPDVAALTNDKINTMLRVIGATCRAGSGSPYYMPSPATVANTDLGTGVGTLEVYPLYGISAGRGRVLASSGGRNLAVVEDLPNLNRIILGCYSDLGNRDRGWKRLAYNAATIFRQPPPVQ